MRGGSGRSKQAAGSDESSPTAIGHRLRRQAALLPSSLVSSRSRLGRQTVIPRACESETSGGLASHNPRAPRPICCALGHAAQTQRRARCTGSVRMNAGPGRPRKTCGCPAAACRLSRSDSTGGLPSQSPAHQRLTSQRRRNDGRRAPVRSRKQRITPRTQDAGVLPSPGDKSGGRASAHLECREELFRNTAPAMADPPSERAVMINRRPQPLFGPPPVHSI